MLFARVKGVSNSGCGKELGLNESFRHAALSTNTERRGLKYIFAGAKDVRQANAVKSLE